MSSTAVPLFAHTPLSNPLLSNPLAPTFGEGVAAVVTWILMILLIVVVLGLVGWLIRLGRSRRKSLRSMSSQDDDGSQD